MAFLKNIDDGFTSNPNFTPDGCLILPGLTPKHQLERRQFSRYPLLQNRYFDPQLYCAGIDPNTSPGLCANLATYPWFGINGIGKYDSKKHKQVPWLNNIKTKINSLWSQNPPDPFKDPTIVENAVRDCIEFKERIGCKAIILPSPLTVDSNSDYSREIFWLDAAIEYLKNRKELTTPVFATIAIRDSCLSFSDPQNNSLVEIILDAVCAREIAGAYLVVEQGYENDYARQMSQKRVLQSALFMTHVIKHDAGKMVGVNFFGAFGLALAAVGADFWASGWYKSRYRFRMADKIAGGRAYPICWSKSALVDIHLEDDFQKLWDAGLIIDRLENTVAVQSLLIGMSQGSSAKQIPSWAYTMNNVSAAQEHFFESMCAAEKEHNQYSGKVRLDYVEQYWLQAAVSECQMIEGVLGKNSKTRLEHVKSWSDAFQSFRRAQNL